jgi:hypothetical protein
VLGTATVAALVGIAYLTFTLGGFSVASTRASRSPGLGGLGIYIDLGPLAGPQTYLARIEGYGWRGSGARVFDARIDAARLLDALSAGLPAGRDTDRADRLVGRRVLAMVSPAAAKALPDHGVATVRLVVMPGKGASTVRIDEVVKPGDSGGRGSAASSPRAESLSTYAAAPGTVITVRGTGFGSSQKTGWISCGGNPAKVVSWSDTAVRFQVPSAMRVPGYVGVVVGAVVSNGLYFAPYDAPVVTDITPHEGPVGTDVTFIGRSFGAKRGSGWVAFAGAAAQVVSWSDTRIVATVPKGAIPGYAGVVANGLSSNGVFYAPYGYPVITAVTPRHALVGETVTVRGRNFGPATGSLTLGGKRVSTLTWTQDSITFVVPRDADSGYVGVGKSAGVSNGVFMTIAPRLSGVSGWWGSPGDLVTLDGEGFGDAPGRYGVLFAGRPAPVVEWSDTRIVARVPADGETGYVGVGSDAGCSNGVSFIVETRASVSGLSTESVSPGTVVTVQGSGFGSPDSSRIAVLAGTPMPVVSWTDTAVDVRIPAGASSGYLGISRQGITSNGRWLEVRP